METIAAILEPVRAALEGASTLPAQYFNVLSLVLPINILAGSASVVLLRCKVTGRTEETLRSAARGAHYALGALPLACALFANPWTVRWLYSRDGELSAATSGLVWATGLALISASTLTLRSTRLARRLDRLASEHAPHVERFLQPAAHQLDGLVGFSLACLLVLNVEAVFLVLNEIPRGPVRQFSAVRADGSPVRGFWKPDRKLGYRPPSNVAANVKVSLAGRVIYDVTYTFGEHGRRVTPRAGSTDPIESIVFFGGSLTFGEGVSDNETLPARLAASLKAVTASNYGYSGYGPQQMLVNLQSDEIVHDVGLPARTAIYTFTDGHVERAIGSYRLVSSFGRFFPYFALDGTGTLRRFGNFESGRPWLSMFYKSMNLSQLVRYFQPGIRTNIRDENLALTAAIIEASDQLFRDRFGGRLYVLLYPGSELAPRLIPHLEQRRVAYFDYSRLFDRTLSEYSLQGDGHPTPLAYQVIAGRLAEDLRQTHSADPSPAKMERTGATNDR